MKKFLIAFSLLLLPVLLLSKNMVSNPGFEQGTNNWVVNGNMIELIKEGSNSVIHLKNTYNEYKDIDQYIPVDSDKIKQITVKAKIKIKDIVPGKEEWEMARVMILFFDKNGTQVGGWPELGRWKNSFDWSEKMNILDVPAGAAKMQLQAQLSNCTGEMWVDDLVIEEGGDFEIPREPENFLENGDLEFGAAKPFYWGGWINGDSAFVSPGYKSSTCYMITNSKKTYSMIKQKIPVPKDTFALVLSGYIKTKDIVRGPNAWEQARISIEFFNDNGTRVGGYPAVAGETIGTVDEWTKWENSYLIPATAVSAEISAGLLECTGTMWVDKLKVIQKTKDGKDVMPVIAQKVKRDDWWEFNPAQDTYKDDAIIDFTDLLDAPAGKHGFISAGKNGTMIFDDGTRAKFWGLNLVAGNVFRSHEDTDKMVKRLAKLGVNLVRLHHMDAPWAQPNIFGNKENSTKDLSSESMDKLDYLIFKLKEAGIYVFFDFLVHRDALKDDGVNDFESIPNGFKEVIFFDKKLQELSKDYIRNILEHENKYTKLRYKEEPALVMSEIVNESTLFYIDRNKDISEKQLNKLDGLFNEYLKEKYGSMDNLKNEWNRFGDSDLSSEEDFNNKTIKRTAFKVNWDDWKTMFASPSTGRGADTKRFYAETEKKYYDEMYKYIKSLGYKALLTGSNHWELWDAELYVNSAYDFIDRHSYWDHPSGGWTLQQNVTYRNNCILKQKMNSVSELAQQRIYNKPFTVSEWNWLLPNQYRSGAPVIMAAYAKYQDWDAMMQFDFAEFEWKNKLEHFADFSKSPDMLSQWAPAVLIFINDYVRSGKNGIVKYVSREEIFENKASSFSIVNDDYMSPQMIKIAKSFDSKDAAKPFSPTTKKGAALSMSGELYWNYKNGLFQINAPKIQGVTGFIQRKETPLETADLSVLSKNKYASVYLYSLDNKTIKSSEKLILNTSADAANSDMKYDSSKTTILFGGSSPIILEPVYAKIKVRTGKYKSAKVYRLDENGYIKDEYKNYTLSKGKTVIYIDTDEKSKTLNYYIKIER